MYPCTVAVICSLCYAKFTLHDFSTIFHSPTGFDKSPTNAQDRRQIGARSREWQSRSVNYQRRDLRESPRRRRRPWNIWHAKYLELSAIHNHAVCNDFWLKLHRRWPSANERQRYRAEGSSGRSYRPEYQYFNRYMYNYIIQKQAQTCLTSRNISITVTAKLLFTSLCRTHNPCSLHLPPE